MLPVTIAPPQSAAGLTLFPLLGAGPTSMEYDLLPDALDSGTVVITEVSEAGSVPELLATNHGPRDVLMLDGMQLIGAKQNRTVSRTILLAAGTTTRIPVSCMEQGRWRSMSPVMLSGLYHSPSKVRRRTRTVESSQAGHGHDGAELRSPAELLSMAQGAVWHAIHESSSKLGTYSRTGALDDVYDATRPRLEQLAASFPPVDGQVGFIAFLGGTPAGADLLNSPAAYARLHDRLVRGYLFDALEVGMAGDGATPELARSFLDQAATLERRPLPTVGRGEYRALAGAMVGGELDLDGVVVHLSAFPIERS
jgi:hypothetical protein